jgi:hypothetical protein
MPRLLPQTICPECLRPVTLGLLGRVIPWHRRDPSRPQPCPGEGQPVPQEVTR